MFYRYLTCRILEFLHVKLKGFDAAFFANYASLLAIELTLDSKKLLVNDKITALRWQTNMYFRNYVKCSKHQKETLKNF